MLAQRIQTLTVASTLALAPIPLFADGFPAHCAGTYLIEEDGGARDFWTFARDGSFFGTTSTQPLLNFSNQQGTWRSDGNEGGRGLLLAFVFDDDNTRGRQTPPTLRFLKPSQNWKPRPRVASMSTSWLRSIQRARTSGRK